MTILDYMGLRFPLTAYAEIFDTMLALNMFLFLFFIVVVMGGGKALFPLVIAKFRNKPLLILGRKDRKIDFVIVKSEGGLFRNRKYGDFMVIPESIYSLMNGVSCGIAYEPYGATLTNELLDSVSTLREFGFNTFGDIEIKSEEGTDAVSNAITTLTEDQKKTEEQLARAIKLHKKFSKKKKLKPEEKKALDESIAIIEQYRTRLFNTVRITRSVDNVRNFFKYNINPHSIRATINRVVADVVQDYTKRDWGKIIIWTLILIIGGALAYFIIQSAMTGGGSAGGVIKTATDSAKVVSGGTIT